MAKRESKLGNLINKRQLDIIKMLNDKRVSEQEKVHLRNEYFYLVSLNK